MLKALRRLGDRERPAEGLFAGFAARPGADDFVDL
jgi:hypothetical protein